MESTHVFGGKIMFVALMTLIISLMLSTQIAEAKPVWSTPFSSTQTLEDSSDNISNFAALATSQPEGNLKDEKKI